MLASPATARSAAGGSPSAAAATERSSTDSMTTSTATASSANPLLTPSPLPYGMPPFDGIKDDDFAPALDAGYAEHLKEIATIANRPEPATFDNTIVALERAGQTLARVGRIFSNLVSANTNPTLQKVERANAPKQAAHLDTIRLNPALFARISGLYEKRETLGLDAESKRLLERYYKISSAPARSCPRRKRRS